ncbi:MAG: CBS domain-containing protein [Burkholderiales bacterium]
MITVSEILVSKPGAVHSIAPDASVFQALKLMAEKDIGAVPVMENGELVGILSERDYARKIALLGKSSTDTPVRQIMTSHVICISPKQTIEGCMALMTEMRIRHLPVCGEDGKVIGMITIGDLVKAQIDNLKFTIEQMEHYVHG